MTEKIKWYEYIPLVLGIIGMITVIILIIFPMIIIVNDIYGSFIVLITVFIPLAFFIFLSIIIGKSY